MAAVTDGRGVECVFAAAAVLDRAEAGSTGSLAAGGLGDFLPDGFEGKALWRPVVMGGAAAAGGTGTTLG